MQRAGLICVDTARNGGGGYIESPEQVALPSRRAGDGVESCRDGRSEARVGSSRSLRPIHTGLPRQSACAAYHTRRGLLRARATPVEVFRSDNKPAVRLAVGPD